MFDPWLMLAPAMLAAIEAKAKLADLEEQMRQWNRDDAIEVEARWIEDVPLLEAMQ